MIFSCNLYIENMIFSLTKDLNIFERCKTWIYLYLVDDKYTLLKECVDFMYFFLFLLGYSHFLLKGETNLVWDSWLPFSISMFFRDQTFIFILIRI
jgi:hypothetical protein